MLQKNLRPAVTNLITPLCKALIKFGITADAITVIGSLGSCLSAIFFFPRGQFFLGTVVVTIFVLSDLLDGTIARLSNSGSTRWGALIDSTLDRLTDSVIVISLLMYFRTRDELLSVLLLVVLVTGFLISYIRARAEGLGVECSIGFAERTERLIILFVGTALYGLGLTIALNIALWVLVGASLLTVAQRLHAVRRY